MSVSARAIELPPPTYSPCLDGLGEAIEAAAALGLDTSRAAAVRERGTRRLGLGSDVYVLALAGGTGVGKSSLLNALAGGEVSRVSALRPTTDEPVAWIPDSLRSALGPLLDWLGVREVREHKGADGPVAVLDLPDLDSIKAEHRRRVDELLPRVDAVAWVADPEKYKDAILHDTYVRSWAPRLERQVVVVNKSDRVAPGDAERIRRDLSSQLERETSSELAVVVTHALGGAEGVDELRAWLRSGIEAKRVVAGRIAADARAAAEDLAARAGVGIEPRVPPLVPETLREQALADVTREVLALVDLDGVERQAVAATRLAARPRGGGPMGFVTSALYRWSGRARVAADPVAFLRRWRRRGSLARAVDPLRRLIGRALADVPPPARPTLAALMEPDALQRGVADAVDGAIATEARSFRVPESMLWGLVGIGQYAVAATLVFAVLWFAALWLVDGVPVGVVDAPLVGPLPMPFVVLVGALLFGYLLALLLGIHAGWVGARWARRIRAAVRAAIAAALGRELFAAVDALDAARVRLASAVRWIRETCAPRTG